MPRDLAALLEELRCLEKSRYSLRILDLRNRIWQMARRKLPAQSDLRVFMDSEDLAQEVLLDLLEAIREFRGRTWKEFFGFVRRILERREIDLARHHSRKKRTPDGSKALPVTESRDESTPTPSVLLSLEEDRERLRFLISKLPLPLKEALLLRLEGRDYAAVSESLSISSANARQRVSRALHQLRTLW